MIDRLTAQEEKAMSEKETKDIQVREKQEVSSPAEQTTPGRVFTPDVDIFETEKELTLLADMPGVKSDKLTIDLREDTLTLIADVEPFEGDNEQDLAMEYDVGRFYRQFRLSEVIDQEKIDAQLKDGVLRLTLPKVEKATPRKIEVRVA
jgi:HSP20 family protein